MPIHVMILGRVRFVGLVWAAAFAVTLQSTPKIKQEDRRKGVILFKNPNSFLLCSCLDLGGMRRDPKT